MSEPQTPSGRALLLRMTTRDTQDLRPAEVIIAAIETEAADRARAEVLAEVEGLRARWARWIGAQRHQTDWACADCVAADLSNNRDLIVVGFRASEKP